MSENTALQHYMDKSPKLQAIAEADMQKRQTERKPQDAEVPLALQQVSGLPSKYELQSFESVPYEEPEYLVKPYIQIKKLNMLQGDTGTGKTALCCKLAAMVSIGGLFQDIQCEQGNVLMISVEDDPSTLRGRIEASGGDLSKCFFPSEAYDLRYTDEHLKSLIEQCQARLVIFDPMQAFLGKIDMHRANETRPVMARLNKIAGECNCSIVLVAHLSKDDNRSTIHRSLGSVDLVGACRSVLHVGRNPDDPGQCVVLQIKASNAPKGRSFFYRIVNKGGVKWEGYCNLTEKDLRRDPKQGFIPYEHSPIVQFIKKVVEENPSPLFISWPSFRRYGLSAVGHNFGKDGREVKSILQPHMDELASRDGIYVTFPDKNRYEREHTECGELKPPASNSARGIEIQKRAQAKEVIL